MTDKQKIEYLSHVIEEALCLLSTMESVPIIVVTDSLQKALDEIGHYDEPTGQVKSSIPLV